MKGNKMDENMLFDNADLVQISIIEEDFINFGENRKQISSYTFSFDSLLSPSTAYKDLKTIIHSEEASVSEQFGIERKYLETHFGASGAGFELVLNVISGMAANGITEILKKYSGKFRPRESSFDSEKALKHSINYLSHATGIPTNLFELTMSKSEDAKYLFVYTERLSKRLYIVSLQKDFEIDEFHVCETI
jgi:hypothetical protein